jgi:alkylation response protein AidB-like acyl-CoA dehydrogenase
MESPFAERLLITAPERSIPSEKRRILNHTIFEGTSEIQQLVIARAISGLRIE